MANSSLNLTSLDFNTLKTEFKTYLQTQSAFKDYNFDGSNMNVLLDVMSYNSYLNSFYLNMVASEMFLDSAQKLDSVVSHAKELNYLPKSINSSEATISFTVTTDRVNNPFTIPKGTLFNGTNANGQYTFVTDQTHTYTSQSTTYAVNNLQIYEGIYTSDSFVYNTTQQYQRFVLTNSNIDVNSLTVTVYEDNGVSVNVYEKKDSLYGITNESTIYFLQAAQNGQYEIVFGDGTIGMEPQNGALIVCEYRISSGPSADGINSFKCIVDLARSNGLGSANITNLIVNSISSGGALAEGIESIRRSAPRYYAAQQRAISADDYSALIIGQFGNLIKDINVYGGETQEPKLYGRVIVAIKPNTGDVAPDYVKNQIQSYVLYRIGLPTRVVIADPDYLYCNIVSTVQYNKNLATITAAELNGKIIDSIKSFNSTNLDRFNSDFRYSRFVRAIDDTDNSITSNDTKINIIKRLAPLLNYATPYEINFENSAGIESSFPGYVKTNRFHDEPVLTSSEFTFVDDNGIEYPFCYFRDDNLGNLVIYTNTNAAFTIVKDYAGAINYTTGNVTIKAFKTSYYQSYISLYFEPKNKDIIVSQNKIISIDPTDVTINIIETVY